MRTDVVVVGAGLTGLTTAFWLKKWNVDVHVVETSTRTGGQIQTLTCDGFVFETGPTTGSVSTPEVAELMMELEAVSGGLCRLETAPDASKRRLIWKGGRFRDLPSGPLSGLTTPLFRWRDKFRILSEPWRKKGDNPDETVGELAERRLGKSFVDYAVDPFISGIYAGNPYNLVTRYALPKLYRLEQDYGSFIRGAIAKHKETKSERDKLATKKVFSSAGGLSRIIEAESGFIGGEHITLGCADVRVNQDNGQWLTSFKTANGDTQTIRSHYVVTTCGAYALPQLLPFIASEDMEPVASLTYAPVIEVNVGLNDTHGGDYLAFGGLVPTVENKPMLGILYPSSCFKGRSPEGGVLFSFFMGGMRHPEQIDLSDSEIVEIVNESLHSMLKFPKHVRPDFIHISRHRQAIPQYDASCSSRTVALNRIQSLYRGLVIAGNLRDGIGMAHRITQSTATARSLANEIRKKSK